MSPEIKTRLLASMNAGRLVVVCGAGLSMAPPSSLPSAQTVAELCFDEYHRIADPNCDPALRGNLEALAEHFVALNMLESIFIERIIPWSRFMRPPNLGHAAVADFLITRLIVAGVSTNLDTLVERRAWDYGFDFRSSLEGNQANRYSQTQSPYLKLHGCLHIDRSTTVWAPSQVNDPEISARIGSSSTWMAANLREKDFLIVGFWSDWAYLNEILESALEGMNPLSITVIDPSDVAQLEEKAPRLWQLTQSEHVSFFHVQESGSDALDELRRSFSINFLRQVVSDGLEEFERTTGMQCDPALLQMAEFDSETLYRWRRDSEGVPSTEPATRKQPENCEVLGYFHLLLRQAGAQQDKEGYQLNGQTIRVINGAGFTLSTLRTRFAEAPSIPSADLVVAVGATDLGLPGNIIPRTRKGDIIRSEATGRWLDVAAARQELQI